MLQNIVCSGAFLLCVLCIGNGNIAAETSGEDCSNPLASIGRVLLQKSPRIKLQIAQPEEGKSEPVLENAASIAPLASSRTLAKAVDKSQQKSEGKNRASVVKLQIAKTEEGKNEPSRENASSLGAVAPNRTLAVVVDEDQQKFDETSRASVVTGEDHARTRLLVQRVALGLVLVSIFVLSLMCLFDICMKRRQEELQEKHEHFDPCLSPRQADGRKAYAAPRTRAPVDTSRLPALSSHHLFPQTFPAAQFGTPFPHPHLTKVDLPGSVANSLMSSSQVPSARSSIGRPYTTMPLQRQSIDAQHPILLQTRNVSPPELSGVVYCDYTAGASPRYSTAAITPRFSTPPTSTSPRMRGSAIGSSTLATEQRVATWRAEIQARVAAATGEAMARRKIIARGGLQSGDGRVDTGIARSVSPGTRPMTTFTMRARTTSPQGQFSRMASQGDFKGVPDFGSFMNKPRTGGNIFDAACDALQDF